jgi:hypothetical protein
VNKVIPIAIGIAIVAIAAGVYYAASFDKDLIQTEEIEPQNEPKGNNYSIDLNEDFSLTAP